MTPAKKGVKKAARTVATRKPQRVKISQVRKALTAKKTPPPPPPPLTHDEAAALRLFEHAHKEFSRGHFAEAKSQFRSLVEKYPNVSEVAARARTYYERAWAALPRSDARTLFAAEIMGRTYFALLQAMERRRYRVFGERVSVPTPKKLGIALRCWTRSRWGDRQA